MSVVQFRLAAPLQASSVYFRMAMNPEEHLKQWGVPFERFEHEPFFSFTEAEDFAAAHPGGHTKNLLLKASKGAGLILVVLEGHKRCNLKALQGEIGRGGLSFASPERMEEVLQLKPGSVSSLALLHETARSVTVYLDTGFKKHTHVYMHPNQNTATLKLALDDWLKILERTGNELHWIDID